MALGLIDEFERNGVRVPDDVSVVGYDDLSYVGVKQIDLTTIRQPTYQMGTTAMKYLIERIRGKATFIQKMTYMRELVIRSTTKSLK